MKQEKSFTLIEILVVIVVTGILSSFVLVGMSSITNDARIAKVKAFANSVRNSLLTSIIFEWKLNNNTNDSWNQNNGTIGGTPTLISDCIEGSCYTLNGSSDYVYIADNDSLFDFQTTMTAFLWIRSSTQQDSRGLLTQFNYGVGVSERAWAIRPCGLANSKLEVIIDNVGDGLTTRKNYRSFTSILDNKWHFVGFTWNNGTLNVYVDGVIENNVVYDDSFITIHNSNASISAGSFFAAGSPAGFFAGDIDYVSLYNKAISSSQIQGKYYSGINRLFNNQGITLDEYNQRIAGLKNSLVNK